MMARNPNWWSMHPPSLFPQYALGSASLPLNPLADDQDPPQSWSQLLLGGLSAGDEDKFVMNHFQPKKLENWEDQILNPSPRVPIVDVIKQEVSQNSNFFGHGDEDFQPPRSACSQMMPVSSPRSCVTSFTNNNNNNNNNNIFDFSYNKVDARNQHPDQSSESSGTASGGVYKKAKLVSSSSQPPLKVRKEKLGDRITALHQLVSPFGKKDDKDELGCAGVSLLQTDTASVLLEAIGYIRFLLGQIELLNESCLKRKGAPNQDTQEKPKELGSRGLCLVPVSCTQHVGNDINGADYWAPAYGSTSGF
ncbi:transcription factor bHLH68-like isoform X3 [Corylus avellana]|uniref:transcription factor bHLH68-like isoform X3 n=1 Tax=Corylus avellana TaxID=13451 RepID=UPI00286AB5F0|nr:transcription factor bHLH68-like isoform X3 [Corylus avellana]